MSDRIIDIRDYLDGPEENGSPGAFSVFGGGGERSRFALPVWRAIFLADGDWGGIIALPKANPEASPVPFFVLDLKEEPARTECFRGSFRKLRGQTAPALATTGGGGMVVRLGDDKERIWFLDLDATSWTSSRWIAHLRARRDMRRFRANWRQFLPSTETPRQS